MKTNWKMMSAVLAAGAMLLATSCSESSSDDATPALGGEIASGQTLVGNVTSDAYLLKDGTYKLSGGLHVKSGATLHIAEGVTIEAIDDAVVDYILVEQGGKIDAQGTASKPIVMTSELKKPGAWGTMKSSSSRTIRLYGRKKSNITNKTFS